MERPTRKYKNYFEEAEKRLSPEQLKRAKAKAQSEIFAIRLSRLREKQGFTQKNVNGFTQPGISKLEQRADMKLSTLLEYLDSIGLRVKISVSSKSKKEKSITLLRSS